MKEGCRALAAWLLLARMTAAADTACLQRIYIPLPEAPARAHMSKAHLGDTPDSLAQADFKELSQNPVTATAADT